MRSQQAEQQKRKSGLLSFRRVSGGGSRVREGTEQEGFGRRRKKKKKKKKEQNKGEGRRGGGRGGARTTASGSEGGEACSSNMVSDVC